MNSMALLCLVLLGMLAMHNLQFLVTKTVAGKSSGLRIRKLNNQETLEALRGLTAAVHHPSVLGKHADLLNFANYELLQHPTALRSIQVTKGPVQETLVPGRSVVVLSGTLQAVGGKVKGEYVLSTRQSCRVTSSNDSVLAWLYWDNLDLKST